MLYAKVSWKNLLIQLERMQPEAQPDCPVVFTYTAGGIRRLLRGLEVVSIRKDHIFPWSIPEYVQHCYRKVWYFGWMPPPVDTCHLPLGAGNGCTTISANPGNSAGCAMVPHSRAAGRTVS